MRSFLRKFANEFIDSSSIMGPVFVFIILFSLEFISEEQLYAACIAWILYMLFFILAYLFFDFLTHKLWSAVRKLFRNRRGGSGTSVTYTKLR